MPRIPPRSTREVAQVLSHFGWHFVRHGAGHDIWGAGGRTVAVPRARGSGRMRSGTVRSILREAGIPVADALAFWGIQPR
jgi:predicted RNA binding protein YcfA (HicA-like mRNA interferase family)